MNRNPILLAAAFASLATSLQAGVLAGWHTFPNGGNEAPLTSEAADYVNPTVSVTVNMGGNVISEFSNAGGGKGTVGWDKYTSGGNTGFDTTYGNVAFPDSPSLTKSGIQLGAGNNNVRFIDISIVNDDLTQDLVLDGIHFDYAMVVMKAGASFSDFEIQLLHVTGPDGPNKSDLAHTGGVPIWRESPDALNSADGANWRDIDIDLSADLGLSDLGNNQVQLADRVLGSGERANFRIAIAGAGTTAIVEADFGSVFALDNIAFSVNTITDPEPTPMWAGYEIDDSGNVDTGAWLGALHVDSAPWIWSFSLEAWLYLPEDVIEESGSWSFVAN